MSGPTKAGMESTAWGAKSVDPRRGAGTVAQRIGVAFEVIQADLPIGSVHHARKLWNHIDPGQPDDATAALGARNGIQIGVFGEESWPAIKAILSACGAEVRTGTTAAPVGLPLEVESGRLEEGASLFWFGRSSRLQGRTLGGGRTMMLVDYEYRSEFEGSFGVRIGFEVRRDDRAAFEPLSINPDGRVINDGRFRLVELDAELTVPRGSTIVVGPSEEWAQTPAIAGGRFFVNRQRSPPAERVYFIKPSSFLASPTGFPPATPRG